MDLRIDDHAVQTFLQNDAAPGSEMSLRRRVDRRASEPPMTAPAEYRIREGQSGGDRTICNRRRASGGKPDR
jgi:hypothetical protein